MTSESENQDLSLPGTYGPTDPGGGPWIEKYQLREWFNPSPSIRFGMWMKARRMMLSEQTADESVKSSMTQAGIAEQMTQAGIKIDASAVARLEKGKRKITLDEAELIARLLGVDIAYMISTKAPDDIAKWERERYFARLGMRPDNGEA
ncbi:MULTISPECIES: helix-turn-helix domain-containing protein [Rhodococcus]|uniref:helix-turn-helix domain-containing protein n=1 Tax=Rhodococcus sp. C-2 TaxID=3018809 RepID=UPI0022EB9C53|nr:helix-turn-helix transcriptional regulator [Rhodococcus sp. C-2]MDA3633988.1 helix-turn-helix transcriptional regulator [Rhodococcus sp. C-2]